MTRKVPKDTRPAAQPALELDQVMTALYIRVSTIKQAEEGYGLEAQRSELDRHCEAQGWIVAPDHIYVDAGVSGKTDERPAFQAMMTAAAAGHVQRIVATKLDRIARNLKNLLQTVDELKKYGCALVIKKEQFDTSTPQGMFVLQMLGAVSELERSMISERVHSGRVENAKVGGFNGAPEAFGYTYHAGAFAINKQEAYWVCEIFTQFLVGKSLRGIARALNDAGASTKHGGQWFGMTVRQTLMKGLYAGLAQWNGIEQDGIYPAIISQETYEQAHRRLQALRPGVQVEGKIARRRDRLET